MKKLIDLACKLFEKEDLFYDKAKDGIIENNGCEYNFNRKIDSLCFKKSLKDFLRTGKKEDAFNIYFCYNEIFKPFGNSQNDIDVLLNLLSNYENKSASLLMKHRDHYSHSVYVFALGLALFFCNDNIKKALEKKYSQKIDLKFFLKHWGFVSLFHDIGYPYEISFVQIKEYSESIDFIFDKQKLLSSYSNLNEILQLSSDELLKCGSFMPNGKNNLNYLFAKYMIDNFNPKTDGKDLDLEGLKTFFENRIINQKEFMDHAYFSAVFLIKFLLKKEDFVLGQIVLDEIMAILLHNSLYKFDFKALKGSKYDVINIDMPFTYLLMLCDELQCWDRMPFGKKSKSQYLSWDFDISLENDIIKLVYYYSDNFDANSLNKIIPNLEKIINVNDIGKIDISFFEKEKDKFIFSFLSNSNFLNLKKVAESINASYYDDFKKIDDDLKINHMVKSFSELSLEYKLSNINQAKSYCRYLEDIGCFFSDLKYDYDIVSEFKKEEKMYLYKKEHIRWVEEKTSMGWKYGIDYKDSKERENKRIHKDIIPFDLLTEEEILKDVKIIDRLISRLNSYGIFVYRLNSNKKTIKIGSTGHIDLSRIKNFNEEKIRSQIRKKIRSISKDNKIEFYSGFADGSDLIFAEEALKCGVDVYAIIPKKYELYANEHKDDKYQNLISQAISLIEVDGYKGISNYFENNVDILFALWDKKELDLKDSSGNEINVGGTYYTLKKFSKEIIHF